MLHCSLRSHACAIALGAILLLTLACSKPAVKVGSVDGAVRAVNNWSIEWSGQNQQPAAADIAGLDEVRTKYGLPEYCRDYVDEIKHVLARDYAFPFYENMPPTGRIVVTLYGTRLSRAESARTDAERVLDELSGDWPESGHVESAVREEGFDWGREDVVKKVDITVYDITGRILTQIFIGGNSADRVKPGFVAESINKAVSGK